MALNGYGSWVAIKKKLNVAVRGCHEWKMAGLMLRSLAFTDEVDG